MKTKIILIKTVEDLEKIRKVEEDSTVVLILTEDIDFVDPIEYFKGNYIKTGKPKFDPINVNGLNVIIYGNGHTISNLNVDINYNDCAGLFSKVDNLYIRNTKFYQSQIKGNDSVGIIAGEVHGKANIRSIEIIGGKVEGKLWVGGMVGYSHEVDVQNSYVNLEIKSEDLYGAVAGLALDNFNSKNVDATVFTRNEDNEIITENTKLCGLLRRSKKQKKLIK
ncbi:MAG: hypothetical protein GX758_03795 [Tenericutes bacterium]|nr:hypothetical protein [Mycoplasmatota bacterium]